MNDLSKALIVNGVWLLAVAMISNPAFAQILKDPVLVDASDVDIIKTDVQDTRDMTQEILNTVTGIRIGTGGTEYLPNDNATIFAQLLDANSRPINIGACNSTVFFPNKTKLLDNQQLTFLEKGIYFHDFTVPDVTGNYITTFDCMFPSSLFLSNRTFFQTLTASGISSIVSEFPFDNTNNVTINSASTTIAFTQTGVASFNYFLNGVLIFISPAGTSNTTTITLSASNLSVAEFQTFSLVRTAGSPMVKWLSLTVNFTSLEPQQIVRGQNEVHVRNDLDKIPLQNAIIINSFEKLSNHNLCLNEITLQHNISLKVGNSPTQQIIQEETCEFGCDTDNNRCNPSPFDTFIYYVIGGIVGFIVLIIIILRLMR